MEKSQSEETPEVVEQEIILDDTALSSIVDGVTKSFETKFAEMQKGFDEKVSALEPTIKKSVDGGAGPEGDDGGLPSFSTSLSKDFSRMPVEQLFCKQLQAKSQGNFALLKDINEYALESRTKANYQNETTNADGGYLVVLPEFEAEITRLLPQYSMIQEIGVTQVGSTYGLSNKGLDTIDFVETLEAAQKTGLKLSYGQFRWDLRKYAGIFITSDELVQDGAVSIFQDAASQFAFAYAKRTEDMILTENGTTSTQPIRKGILHTAGVNLEPTSGAGSTITWNDLLNAKYAVPTVAQDGGVYVMHRSTFNTLRQQQGTTNYYQVPGAFIGDGGNITPWGDRIILSDAMPVNASSGIGTTVGAPAVYGNFKRFAKFYQKGGLDLQYSNEATVHDSGSTATNLWEKDMTALRAVWRGTAAFKYPEAFCIIGQTPLS